MYISHLLIIKFGMMDIKKLLGIACTLLVLATVIFSGCVEKQTNTENVTKTASDATVWNDKGTALGYLGKYDEAIQAYNEAIKINPQHAAAWNNKGEALRSQGKYDEAIK